VVKKRHFGPAVALPWGEAMKRIDYFSTLKKNSFMQRVVTLLLAIAATLCGMAQNVGIGTNAPQGRLQINHRSSTAMGLMLIDSANLSAGSMEFRNVNNTRRIVAQGYAANNFNNGQYLDIKSDSVFIATFQGNGRLGVNNPGPSYPLDVTGDINTTGALRINGLAGTGGQVLRSNGNGTMAWDDMCQYNNFVTLRSVAAASWTVPAGVTKILVEVWGAGGGGNVLAGGGAGGYIKAHFTVAPGDVINYTTGDGGAGAISASATNGTNSVCTAGAVSLTAGGGQGALYLSATNGQGGVGGNASASGAFANYIALFGGSGKSQERTFFQYNATTYYESGKAGRGGEAPNNADSGGAGQSYLYNTTGATLVFRNGNPSGGLIPGGGGASGVQYGITNISGGAGADGIIIVHY
jgi:hypothetical protein